MMLNILKRDEHAYQAVVNQDIDYFYQKKRNGTVTIKALNTALHDCCHLNLSGSFSRQLVELGANNLNSVLASALSKDYYAFASHLFTIQTHINPFDSNHYDEHFLTHIVNLAQQVNGDSANNLRLFKNIILSIPNHTQKISDDKRIYRGMNDYALYDYDYIYNQLLSMLLSKIRYQSHLETALKQQLVLAITILAQRSFFVSVDNLNYFMAIKDKEPELLSFFARRINHNPQQVIKHIDYIEDVDDEFYCTDMAQRRLAVWEFWDNGHELKRQKFRVYLELARHLKTPASLNKTMWQALCRSWLYQKRMPDIEEYHFLKTLKHSTANHQKLLHFFNRYVYFERVYLNDTLAQKLDNLVDVENKNTENGVNKI